MIQQKFAEAFADAKAHARQEFPAESCGVISGGKYYACENVAEPAKNHKEDDPNCPCKLCSFRIAPEVYQKFVLGDGVDFIVHSHPNGPFYPSRADMEGQIQTAVPWAIIALDEERVGDPVCWGDQLPIAPILGRTFMHGVHDCYSLVRDCFRLGREELAKQDIPWRFDPVKLIEVPRNDAWWDAGDDLYMKNFIRAGFFQIDQDEAEPGDCFLMKIRSEQFNHAGILIDNNLIIHHLPARLSRREPAGIWARQAGVWLRYAGVPVA